MDLEFHIGADTAIFIALIIGIITSGAFLLILNTIVKLVERNDDDDEDLPNPAA